MKQVMKAIAGISLAATIIFSFLPVIASVWVDLFFVFFITSMAAACFDLTFVMMQRYNRGRILKVIERQRA